MPMKPFVRTSLAILALVSATSALATETYIFAGPPRESVEKGVEVYGPVAEYLSAATGKRIVYQHPNNWLLYQTEMQKGAYDLVYDGPAFVSWRIAQLGHEPLATLSSRLAFVIAVREDYAQINTLADLSGRTVCGFGPPNFATLTLLSLFPNPSRQPYLVEVKTLKEAHQGVLAGKCMGAVMRDKAFAKMHKNSAGAKVIHRTAPVANQTFTAGPRFSAEDKARMTAALLAPEAKTKIAKFLARFNRGEDLVKADREDYTGLSGVLQHSWGFETARQAAR